ncbi:hypothetical protein A2154_02220 [Candidatus Gottesmanbacteria bacterium RBG_16_43_7]|uniref:Uncharacterized protein n=1 Tax=Candidatus Gottesmanbacteria bacterium RBG_16_43_7 TaxID=1798373 RepID=A0A1F5Z927_9BACT|nr:MAG: hypothetical protein A2154_02220 [Candidatus Gottesmanbacteria bacterium RBG_16_43_7]
MQLTDQALSDFQQIFFKEYGKRINRDMAVTYGLKLIDLVKTVGIDKVNPKIQVNNAVNKCE